MANPGWVDKWSLEDLKQLVFKREVERKSFAAIAVELGQNEGSCGRRYREIIALREDQPLSAPAETEKSARRAVHKSLGIETFVHMQAILCSPYDGRFGQGNKSQSMNAHWYRYPITLAKVFHEAS
jgi:hypothetical protein